MTATATITKAAKRLRSLEQNARLWSMLTDFSEQLPWTDWTGRRIRMTPDQWKDFFTATLAGEQTLVPSEDGDRLIMIGHRTSKMSIEAMSELQDCMEAFAARHGVRLRVASAPSEPASEPGRSSPLPE